MSALAGLAVRPVSWQIQSSQQLRLGQIGQAADFRIHITTGMGPGVVRGTAVPLCLTYFDVFYPVTEFDIKKKMLSEGLFRLPDKLAEIV